MAQRATHRHSLHSKLRHSAPSGPKGAVRNACPRGKVPKTRKLSIVKASPESLGSDRAPRIASSAVSKAGTPEFAHRALEGIGLVGRPHVDIAAARRPRARRTAHPH